MRASVDADGCCTRALARLARPQQAEPLPAAMCRWPALLCLHLPAPALICFDLIWSSLCHHQPSPDSRSFLWEVVRGTNHTSLNSKSRARKPPPVGPSGVVTHAHTHTRTHTQLHARTERERVRAGEGQRASQAGFAPGLLRGCCLLSDIEREMATARF